VLEEVILYTVSKRVNGYILVALSYKYLYKKASIKLHLHISNELAPWSSVLLQKPPVA
jgi:hypothetical protein